MVKSLKSSLHPVICVLCSILCAPLSRGDHYELTCNRYTLPCLRFRMWDFSYGKTFMEMRRATAECVFPVTAQRSGMKLFNGTRANSRTCTRNYRNGSTIVCYWRIMLRRYDNMAHEWKCHAYWSGKYHYSAGTRLNVTFLTSQMKMSPYHAGSVRVGSTVNVTCETDSGNPTPRVEWRLDGEAISDGEQEYTITTSAKQGDHNANYTSSILSFVASEKHINKSIDCHLVAQNYSIASIPDSIAAWASMARDDSIEGNPMPLSDQRFKRFNLQRSKVQRSKPRREEGRRLEIQGYDGPIHEGDKLTLKCQVLFVKFGARFKWMYTKAEDEPEKLVSEEEEISMKATQADSGLYTCKVITGYGRGTSVDAESVHVQVLALGGDTPPPAGQVEAQVGGEEGVPIGPLAGGIVAALVVIALAVLAVFFLRKKQAKDRNPEKAPVVEENQ